MGGKRWYTYLVNGIRYESADAAGKAFGLDPATVRARCDSRRFPAWTRVPYSSDVGEALDFGSLRPPIAQQTCACDLGPEFERIAGEHPSGYIARSDWAMRKLITHKSKRCPKCNLYTVWIPKNERRQS